MKASLHEPYTVGWKRITLKKLKGSNCVSKSKPPTLFTGLLVETHRHEIGVESNRK